MEKDRFRIRQAFYMRRYYEYIECIKVLETGSWDMLWGFSGLELSELFKKFYDVRVCDLARN